MGSAVPLGMCRDFLQPPRGTVGGTPFGSGLSSWLKESSGFNVDNVNPDPFGSIGHSRTA